MGRKKGAMNKHHKEKPHKEKKARGRPKGSIKQKQIQNVHININGGGDDSHHNKKPSLPAQLPLSIFNPSLIQPDYGINDRQPVNPLTDTTPDLLTPFIQAMISTQQPIKQPQQPITQPQQQQQQITQPPIIIIPPPTKEKQKEPKPEILKPPEHPHYHFTHEDVEKYIEKIHEKNKNVELPPNEPNPIHKGLIDNIIGSPADKYDGLKMQNKTMPFSKVVKGSLLGVGGGVAMGLAGPSIVNNVVATAASTAGGVIGYQLTGDESGVAYGSMLGGIAGAKFIDKYNKAYPERTNTNTNQEHYEEIPNGSLVGGGTVISTGRQTTSSKKKKDTTTLHSKLLTAIKETNSTPATTQDVQQKIKESKLLKDLESKQKYGTADITPPEPKPTILEQFKDVYRRLSGQKKGNYTKLKTNDDDDDFSTTLSKAKTTGKKQGTYAILPEEEIDVEKELEKMAREKKLKMEREKKIEPPITQEPPLEWSAMKKLKERNEHNIRESIARTDAEEKRRQKISSDIDAQVRYLLGDAPEPPPRTPPPAAKPPKPPRTPKQQLIINNFGKLVGKTQDKINEDKYKSILQDAEPLITKRILTKKKSELETQAAKIEKKMEKKHLQMINQLENQIQRTENMLDSTRKNINEQRPEGLRKKIKQLQDKKSDLITRQQGLTRDVKKQELKKVNQELQHYENIIMKRKPGPKVKEKVEQYEGMAKK